MTTYLLDELTIGHIRKTVRVTNGKAYHQGELLNFETTYQYGGWHPAVGAIKDREWQKPGVILTFRNGTWYGDPKSDTFTVVD